MTSSAAAGYELPLLLFGGFRAIIDELHGGLARRGKLTRLTPRGVEALALSAEIFDGIRDRWARTLGDDRVADLEASLRTMVPGEPSRLDVPGWFGASYPCC